jgi:hypothetical protein
VRPALALGPGRLVLFCLAALSLGLGDLHADDLLPPPSLLTADFGLSASSTTSLASAKALPPGFSATGENPYRRFEIIALGSFPLTLLYTNLAFQITHYAENGFDARWAPWPFSGEYTDSISDSERFSRMGVAAGLSFVVAGIDALVRLSREKKAAARVLAQGPGQGQGLPEEGSPPASPRAEPPSP